MCICIYTYMYSLLFLFAIDVDNVTLMMMCTSTSFDSNRRDLCVRPPILLPLCPLCKLLKPSLLSTHPSMALRELFKHISLSLSLSLFLSQCCATSLCDTLYCSVPYTLQAQDQRNGGRQVAIKVVCQIVSYTMYEV